MCCKFCFVAFVRYVLDLVVSCVLAAVLFWVVQLHFVLWFYIVCVCWLLADEYYAVWFALISLLYCVICGLFRLWVGFWVCAFWCLFCGWIWVAMFTFTVYSCNIVILVLFVMSVITL